MDRDLLGASWGLLGASWGLLGASRGPIGGLLGPPGGVWGPRARNESFFPERAPAQGSLLVGKPVPGAMLEEGWRISLRKEDLGKLRNSIEKVRFVRARSNKVHPPYRILDKQRGPRTLVFLSKK